MENLKADHQAFQELLDTVQTELSTLEEDVKTTSEEISKVVEKLNEKELTEEDIINKSTEELLGIEVLEGNKRRMEVDGTSYEFEAKETDFEALTEEATDEEILEAIRKYDIPEKDFAKFNKEERLALVNYFREQEALYAEMDRINKEYQEKIEKINRQYEEVLIGGSKEDTIKLLKEKKALYLEYNKKSAAFQIDKLIEEIENSINLNPIKKSVKKIKNHKKIVENFDKDLQNANKKFYSKLKKNRNSKFIYRENLHEELMKRFDLSEFNAKLFVYLFYGFAHTEKIISQNSVFINEVIKNICTTTLVGQDKETFVQSILEINAIVCE